MLSKITNRTQLKTETTNHPNIHSQIEFKLYIDIKTVLLFQNVLHIHVHCNNKTINANVSYQLYVAIHN